MAYSSIVLMPPQLGNDSVGYGAYYTEDTITFGSVGSYASYTGDESILTLAETIGTTPVYDIINMGFGITYSSDNTAYYYNFTRDNTTLINTTAVFTPNYEGMGLPSDIYSQYTTLVQNASSSLAVCSSETDGFCYIPGASCVDWEDDLE